MNHWLIVAGIVLAGSLIAVALWVAADERSRTRQRSRYASNEEARAAGKRMMEKHRKTFERLAAPDRDDKS